MAKIAEAGKGVILYMRQEGRGIGLLAKLRAYQLQQVEKLDTVEANQRLGYPGNLREYGIGARFCSTWGCGRFVCSQTTRRRWWGWRGTACGLWSGSRFQSRPTRRMCVICGRRKTSWGTCWTWIQGPRLAAALWAARWLTRRPEGGG